MSRVEATMSAGFQITVPSLLRKKLDLKPGDWVVFDMDGDVVRVEKSETREEKIKRAFAELDKLKAEREKEMTPEQKKIVKMTKGWTINQYHEYFDNLPETKAYLKEKYGVKVA